MKIKNIQTLTFLPKQNDSNTIYRSNTSSNRVEFGLKFIGEF